MFLLRKLIEGEDSRLSTMVQNLSLTRGLDLTSSVSVRASAGSASVSDSSAPAAAVKLDGTPGDSSGSSAEKMAGTGEAQVKMAASETLTDLEEQATEMSERRTVLIR